MDPAGHSLGEVSDLDERTDLVLVGCSDTDVDEIVLGSEDVEMRKGMSKGWKMTERPDVVPRHKWPLGLSVSVSHRVFCNRSRVSG